MYLEHIDIQDFVVLTGLSVVSVSCGLELHAGGNLAYAFIIAHLDIITVPESCDTRAAKKAMKEPLDAVMLSLSAVDLLTGANSHARHSSLYSAR